MSQDALVRDYLCRPARYAAVDGTNEISAGLTWLGLTVLAGVPDMKVSLPMVMCWLVLVTVGVRVFKSRVTYRRTGYVAFHPTRLGLRAALVFCGAAVVAAGIAVLATRHRFHPSLLVAPGMALYYIVTVRPAAVWQWGIAVVMAAGMVALPMLGLEETPLIIATLCYYGAAFAISGVVSLILYLRRTQAPQ